MTIEQTVTVELLKLILQLGGAFLLARLTVNWALARFKSEKAWERETQALADVLSSLREMERVYGIWINDYMIRQDVSSPALTSRLRSAMVKFESVSGIAILILPKHLADLIENIEGKLIERQEPDDDWFQHIDAKSAMIGKSIADLLIESKKWKGSRF